MLRLNLALHARIHVSAESISVPTPVIEIVALAGTTDLEVALDGESDILYIEIAERTYWKQPL